jgi:hypothetical protein
VEAFMITVAFVVTATAVALHLRWFLAARENPLTGFLSRSNDPEVESRRRAFLLSVAPVVLWGWVMLFALQP